MTEPRIEDPKDWYNVTIKQVAKYGGCGLLNRYNGSLLQALRVLYPEYSWLPWSFSKPHHAHGRRMFSKTQLSLWKLLRQVE